MAAQITNISNVSITYKAIVLRRCTTFSLLLWDGYIAIQLTQNQVRAMHLRNMSDAENDRKDSSCMFSFAETIVVHIAKFVFHDIVAILR